MTRRVVVLLFLFLALTAAMVPAPLNGSIDGRLHSCGYITDDGVTDHLAAFHHRCPHTSLN